MRLLPKSWHGLKACRNEAIKHPQHQVDSAPGHHLKLKNPCVLNRLLNLITLCL